MHGQELHPSQDSVRRWRYSPAEVARQVSGGVLSSRDEGKTTAAAFAMFREAKTLADVVIALELPVGQVRRMRTEYDALAGMVSICQEDIAALRELLGGDVPQEGAALVCAMTEAVQRAYARGYGDGRSEAEDYGEIIDFSTGQRRRVPPDPR